MKDLRKKYLELCLKLDEADNETNTRKYNQAVRQLNKLSLYLSENTEEAIFLVELMGHDNLTVRGDAAISCYNRGINPEQAIAVMEEVYKNAPAGNLRAGLGIKLGLIRGSITLPH